VMYSNVEPMLFVEINDTQLHSCLRYSKVQPLSQLETHIIFPHRDYHRFCKVYPIYPTELVESWIHPISESPQV
jgi:hypothetical protein